MKRGFLEGSRDLCELCWPRAGRAFFSDVAREAASYSGILWGSGDAEMTLPAGCPLVPVLESLERNSSWCRCAPEGVPGRLPLPNCTMVFGSAGGNPGPAALCGVG